MTERRKEARIQPARTVLVWCETWGEFFSRYAGDVSAGGMFILADGVELPGVGEHFTLRLALPEGHEITLEAKVAHVVSAGTAKDEQVTAGIGVEFVNMSDEMQSAIHRLVEFARQRGHEQSVSTSYAGWLFDYEAPVPLQEVVETLEGHSQPRPRKPSGSMARVEPPGSVVRARDASSPENAGEAEPAAEPPEASPELTARLDLQMTAALQHLAHKRAYEASVVLKEILEQDPSHAEARKWKIVLNAREMIEASRDAMAAVYYKKVLDLDPQNLEAKKFVAEHEKNKRLEALPFGHLFVKPKK